AAARPCLASADCLALAGGGGLSRPSDDPDGDLRAPDGGQAAHGLGLRDVGARGLGLVASTALLPDRARRARAARVDGPQAHAPTWARRGGRLDALRDREGTARDA